ncbi:hypothetical protein [Leptotrichia hongkongensis]|uniref:hypothetical protein n=1 Tax=Leptotrichia hongkongensis TaxID=554406 RepID=UPI0035A88EBB
MNSKIYELYKKEIFVNPEELNKLKKYINEENKVCGKDALKGNLRDNISYNNPGNDKNHYYYYFKMSNEKFTVIKVNKKFPVELETNSKDDDSKIIKIRKENLETVGEAIIYYYSEIVKYFQIKIATLDFERLYEDYSEEGLKKIEKIIQEITLFYAKMYYRYPIREVRSSSTKLHEVMEEYNIDEQFNELEKTVSLIRDIINYQLERKREKEKEKEDKRSENWNKIFAAIGIALAVIEIVQGFLIK